MEPITQPGISAAPGAVEWLRETRSPRLLHIFDQTINLVNEHNRMLSINTLKTGNGPFALVTNRGGFKQLISTQSPVSVNAERVTIGALHIDCRQLKNWDPRPEWKSLTHSQIDLLQRMIQNIFSTQPQKNNFSVVTNPSDTDIETDSPFIPVLAQTISKIQTGFQQGHEELILEGAGGLAGMGGGLTPAGDDFLIGLIHGLWAIKIDQAQPLCRRIAQTAAPRTNTLSASWLQAASAGEATQTWHDFLHAIPAESPAKIQSAIQKLIDVGHTSGADALAGFLFILQQED
jgi:hypothetical protein